jgi:glycosyltransferase involved in cell wall biosynthesis
MSRLRVRVVYEHGTDLVPYGSAELRLLRPLRHPAVRPWLEARFERRYRGAPADIVIFDRLLGPRTRLIDLEAQLRMAREAGAVVVHSLDDSFLDLGLERPYWADRGQPLLLQRLLSAADGLLVTTEPLARRLAGFCEKIIVLPNALDERLFAGRESGASTASGRSAEAGPPDGLAATAPGVAISEAEASGVMAGQIAAFEPLRIGYMGTFTHAEDLALVLPALRALAARRPGAFELEVVGVADPATAGDLLDGIPWRPVPVPPECQPYDAFMPWFTGTLRWDLALAPLVDTPFTRCKSDLKHLDYAALGAAGLFSRVEPYAATLRHGETGWLVPNQPGAWESALERLLDDAALRARLAQNARRYLMEERTLAASGWRWVAALEALRAGGGGLAEAGGLAPTIAGAVARKPSTESEVGPGDAGPDSASLPPDPAILAPDSAVFSPDSAMPTSHGTSPHPPRRVTVLYEYGHGAAYEPHASAHLRLIRPLSHPAAGQAIEPRFRPDLDEPDSELVIVDRLWRPDIAPQHVDRLLNQVRTAGSRLICALDDNLLDLRAERGDWPTPEHEAILRSLLAEAEGLLVSSQALADRLRPEAPRARIAILPNALDERLLGPACPAPDESPFGPRPLVIGYMGTATHDADLEMVVPALEALARRHGPRIRIELLGVLGRPASRARLAQLPVRCLHPHPADREYTRFLPWFSSRVGWDIAIAPLVDTPFTRCKSDIKFLDYCAIGAAAVCSDVPAYAGTVRHGESGLLLPASAEVWEAALEDLLADAERRRALAAAGRRYLSAERILARRAQDWPAALLGMLG